MQNSILWNEKFMKLFKIMQKNNDMKMINAVHFSISKKPIRLQKAQENLNKFWG